MARPTPRYTFETADLEHVKTMILMHHLMCAIIALRCGQSSHFEGDTRAGMHSYSDEQESDFWIAWSDDGVAALAFHKYCYEPDVETADPLRWLADEGGSIPTDVADLARRVRVGHQQLTTSGMLITSQHRYRRGSRKNRDNGLDLLEAFTAHHSSAFQRWNGPIGISDAQGELAWKLAKRARAGGGELDEREVATLLDPRQELDELFLVTAEKIATVTDMLGTIALRLRLPDDLVERERAELDELRSAELDALTDEDLALFRAAVENDAAGVKHAIARGARTDTTSVKRMLPELKIKPGWSPLAIAFHRRSLDAALALVESGASIAEDSGDSALLRAVGAHSVPVLRACLARNPSKEMLTKPLFLAIQTAKQLRAANLSSILTELLDAGAVVDERVMSFARRIGDTETMLLLEQRRGEMPL